CFLFFFFFSSRRRHTRFSRDWSSDVCSSDLAIGKHADAAQEIEHARRLDPRSLSATAAAGMVYFYAGDLKRAVDECDRALALDQIGRASCRERGEVRGGGGAVSKEERRQY